MGCACEKEVQSQAPLPVSEEQSVAAVSEQIMRTGLKEITTIRQLKGDLSSEYSLSGTVTDSRGKVVSAEYLHTHQPCVIRLIPKSKSVALKKLRNELKVLSRLDHPQILQIYEALEDTSYYYLVSESFLIGEFERRVTEPLTEHSVASILGQVLSALCYCHMQGIAHRNIRLETIVIQEKTDGDQIVMLSGFSESTFFSSEETMNTAVGSCYFIAPEVLRHSYNEKCDLWSCGVLAYYLLSGQFPFSGSSPSIVLEKVKNGEVEYTENLWESISAPAKDFVSSLLQREPEARPSALVALSHPWIATNTTKLSFTSRQVRNSLGNMLGLRAQAALKQAVMSFIVNRIVDKKELFALRESFKVLDLNGDGQISEAELRMGLGKILPQQQAESEARRIMTLADGNQNGVIDYSEFMISAFPEEKLLDINNLRLAFDSFDKDLSGKITIRELQESMMVRGRYDETEIWDQLVKQVDTSGDGEVDFGEFVHMMKRALS